MAPKPTREEIEEAFKKVDIDGVGKLNKDQLKALMISVEDEKNRADLEKNMTENMMNMVFNMADEDGDKMVSLDELLKLLEIGEQKEKDPFEMMMKMLKAADEDGDGFLDEEELTKFMNSTSGRAPDVKFLMQAADTNGDGKVSIEEAATYLTKKK